MSGVRRAVITAGGRATRMLPISRGIQKSMLPIVDLPVIYYLVEEAVNSGITDILIILGERDTPIEKFFASFLADGDALSGVRISYAYQQEPTGLAHAVMLAREFVSDEPFLVLYGDDVIFSDVPVSRQLICAYEKYGCTILGVQSVEKDKLSQYCSLRISDSIIEKGIHECLGVIEKPGEGEGYSSLSILGRVLLTSDIFAVIERLAPGRGGEYQLTDAIDLLVRSKRTMALEFSGDRYDLGSKIGFLKANVAVGLKHEETAAEFRQFLEELTDKWI